MLCFFKSKQSILRVERFWIFHGVTIDAKLVHQVHKMITAGIYDYLEDIFLQAANLHDLKNEPQAFSLGDKIQACF